MAARPTAPWCGQSGPIAVAQNTDYFFEAFVMNVCCSSAVPRQFAVDPRVLGGRIDDRIPRHRDDEPRPGRHLGRTEQELELGRSTPRSSLSLINRNTAAAGNDFAIDDVFLGTTSTVTPVPEPETYALMLAGLGIVGAIARRRRRA